MVAPSRRPKLGKRGTATYRAPSEFRAWVRGFERLPEEVAIIGRRNWTGATQIWFAESQDAVHIESGDLLASGRADTFIAGGRLIIGELRYGGVMGTEGPVDYAHHENNRGGDHAYIDNSYSAASEFFDEAMGSTWRDVVRSWR